MSQFMSLWRRVERRGRTRHCLRDAGLRHWMAKYEEEHADLSAECRGIDENIRKFDENFDLSAIL